jgi:hypothetical protein
MATQDEISIAIRKTRHRFISTGKAQSYWSINNGQCDDFASEVIALLGDHCETLFDVCNENFMVDNDGFKDQWDWALLAKHWGIECSSGLTKEQISGIEFGSHVWVTDGIRHYDCECPEGTLNFFDLPIFKRYIVMEMRRQGMVVEDVVTNDVCPPPVCPVENPVFKGSVYEAV